MTRIPLWHECKQGNSFGMWSDAAPICPACGVIETLPTVRKIYDEYDMPPTLITRDTYPQLVNTWEPGQVRGMQ